MNKSNKFSPEVRERAVRMVQEHRGEYPSLWAAVETIAPKIGCVVPEYWRNLVWHWWAVEFKARLWGGD